MKKRLLKEQVEQGLRRELFAREAVARAHARADKTERAAREARETVAKAEFLEREARLACAALLDMLKRESERTGGEPLTTPLDVSGPLTWSDDGAEES